MDIRILGTRGQIKPSHPNYHNHSGVLIDNVLFDLGEPSFLKYAPQTIFVTHLHPDHAFFMYESVKHPPAISVSLFAPESAKLKGITVTKFTGITEVAGLTVTSVPTAHSKKVLSQGYVVENGSKRIFYTGDVAWLKKDIIESLGKFDLVLTEGSYLKKGGRVFRDKCSGYIYGHTGIPNLVKLFGEVTKHVVITHFGSWFYKNIDESKAQIASLGDEYGISVTPAYDGMFLPQAKASG